MSIHDDDSKFHKISRPADWLFVFACPTTRWQFFRAKAVGEFCHHFPRWADYDRGLLCHFNQLFRPLVRQHGLQVAMYPDLAALSRKARAARNLVVFAHCDWRKERVELREGMVSYHSFVGALPTSFDGFVDLSVCKPRTLPLQLKQRHPAATVKSAAARLDPVPWLHFYAYLFIVLGTRSCTYAEALIETTHKFIDAFERTDEPKDM